MDKVTQVVVIYLEKSVQRFWQDRRFPEIRTFLETLKIIHPKKAFLYHFQSGCIYFREHQVEKALEEFEQSLELDEKMSGQILKMLEVIYTRTIGKRKWEQALAVIKLMLELPSKKLEELYYRRAILEVRLENFEEAFPFFHMAWNKEKLKPKITSFLKGCYNQLLKEQKYQESLEVIQELVSNFRVKDSSLHYRSGLILAHLERNDEALSELRKAWQMGMENDEISQWIEKLTHAQKEAMGDKLATKDSLSKTLFVRTPQEKDMTSEVAMDEGVEGTDLIENVFQDEDMED